MNLEQLEGLSDGRSLEDIPDELLMKSLSYLPFDSFLPIAHISKRFRLNWINMKQCQRLFLDDIKCTTTNTKKRHTSYNVQCELTSTSSSSDYQKSTQSSSDYIYRTNPLSIGNLFELPWHSLSRIITASSSSTFDDHDASNDSKKWKQRNQLNISLLKYYLENGWCNIGSSSTNETICKTLNLTNSEKLGSNNMKNCDSHNRSNYRDDEKIINDDDICHNIRHNIRQQSVQQQQENRKKILKKVMMGCSARGDIHGMAYLNYSNIYNLVDEEICTTAGAAGQLDALKWLRGDKKALQMTLDILSYSPHFNHLWRDQIVTPSSSSPSSDTIMTRLEDCSTEEDHHQTDIEIKLGHIPPYCPWDITEVHREASENLHTHVLNYVESNCGDDKIEMLYGDGLPWN